MDYISTRDRNRKVSSAEAIVAGLSPDGGLFLPEQLPAFSLQEISALVPCAYPQRAAEVLSRFLTDFTKEELLDYTARAYSAAKFPPKAVAPVIPLGDGREVLELFHGPTCAFKDFALQLLPLLLTASLRKTGADKTVVILVATSGDTGKAALEGFADVPGTKICVFYPHGGTSNIQRLQMSTQSGENVMVLAVQGNFDDAQNGVKAIFTDKAFAERAGEKGFLFSSANSINWGRLAPQIAYYFSAYCELVAAGRVKLGEAVNITVPTGNFGNILAAYYAKQCGLPVKRLICASNENNVLTDFIRTGVYDRNRPFHLTLSPSMDILISSNLERLLFLLADGDDARIRGLMDDLKATGRYDVGPAMLARLSQDFWAGCADDAQTVQAIGEIYKTYGYLADTHTAVGLRVSQEYRQATDDAAPMLVASTASPFKFAGSVLPAIGGPKLADDFALLDGLAAATGQAAPQALSGLRSKPERFTKVCTPAGMPQAVADWLGL